MAALDLSRSRDVEYTAGLALALSAVFSRSEALAGDLEKRFPEDTFVKFTYIPVLRAEKELSPVFSGSSPDWGMKHRGRTDTGLPSSDHLTAWSRSSMTKSRFAGAIPLIIIRSVS